MKHYRFLISQCLVAVVLLAALFANPYHARAQAEQPATIALLPFEIHSSKDISYLKDGIRNMLACRLSANAGVNVVDTGQVDSLVKKKGDSKSDSGLKNLGSKLNTDYLITGSITNLGSALSIDAKVIGTSKQGDTQIFYATANNDNEVIPAIDKLAADIGVQVFGMPNTPQATATQPALQQSASPTISMQTAHPDRAFITPIPGGVSIPATSPILTE